MNREILFRAKRITDNQWVYGGIAIAPDETVVILTKEEQIVWNVIPETVGQFTGLYDKTRFEDATAKQREYAVNIARQKGTDPKKEWKGVRIFEGDIVDLYGNISACKFTDGCFIFGGKFGFAFGHDVEVIGNIHDNPELLK